MPGLLRSGIDAAPAAKSLVGTRPNPPTNKEACASTISLWLPTVTGTGKHCFTLYYDPVLTKAAPSGLENSVNFWIE